MAVLDWDCPDCGERNEPLAVMCRWCHQDTTERWAVRALDADPVDFDED